MVERRGFQPKDAIQGILLFFFFFKYILSNHLLLSQLLISSFSYYVDLFTAFNDARGHNIERVNYLQDLHQRKNEVCRNPSPLFRRYDDNKYSFIYLFHHLRIYSLIIFKMISYLSQYSSFRSGRTSCYCCWLRRFTCFLSRWSVFWSA